MDTSRSLCTAASREIFEKINTVLEVQFVEDSSANGTNVIAIAQSFQEKHRVLVIFQISLRNRV